jgi:regulator of replication initiation timing
MSLIESFDTLISEIGTSKIHKAHIALLKETIQTIVDENESLKKENARLVEENAKLRGEIAEKTVLDEFVEERGILFKKKPGGGYHETPYCPRCRLPMASGFPGFPLQCLPCKHIADITRGGIPDLLKRLP